MVKKSLKRKSKINEKELIETLKKGLVKKLELPAKSQEKPKESAAEVIAEFEEIENPTPVSQLNRPSFSLENKIFSINPSNLEQIGQQEPKTNTKQDKPYVVKYDSLNYEINKNYGVFEDVRKETTTSENRSVDRPPTTFDKNYSTARVEQEHSGIEDVKSAEQGYLHSPGRRKNH